MHNTDWQNPDWTSSTKVHDWRNHVSQEVQCIWWTFTEVQKKALYNQATEVANNEEWE